MAEGCWQSGCGLISASDDKNSPLASRNQRPARANGRRRSAITYLRRQHLNTKAMTAAAAAALTLLFGLSGCTSPSARQAHPLANTIVHATLGASVSRASLTKKMADADIVYLGEKHDNPVHHQHQLWALSELLRLHHRPALGFEIFATDQNHALTEYISTADRTRSAQDDERAAAHLRASTGMQNALDEPWLAYGPLLQLARAHQLSVFGIDLPLELRRRVSRVGIAGLTAVERRALPRNENGSDDTDPGYRNLMLSRLKAAHCGHGEAAYLQRLFENWQARNETMARAIIAALAASRSTGNDTPVLVILGDGHVRDGDGVVARVAQHIPGARQLILRFIEVNESSEHAADYLSGTHASTTRAIAHEELLWFTAAHGLSMVEACKAFQKSNKKTGS